MRTSPSLPILCGTPVTTALAFYKDALFSWCPHPSSQHAKFSRVTGSVTPSGNQASTRPAIANERLSVYRAGQVVLKLKTAWCDGTSHHVMAPMEFMQRLGALVPRPRLLLIRFHGLLAPHAKLQKPFSDVGTGFLLSKERL